MASDKVLAERKYRLGYELELRGDIAGARSAYREAVALDPDHVDAHINLGCLLHDRRLDLATAHYERAAALRPEDAIAHYNLGVAREDAGRVDDAIAEYKHALRLQPDIFEAAYNLSRLISAMGDSGFPVMRFADHGVN